MTRRPDLRVAAGSALFAAGQVSSVVFFSLLTLLLAPLPFRPRQRVAVGWNRFNLWWLKVCCGVRYQVEGEENIPATAGVVMAKHQSAWETIALVQWFMPQCYVMKRELLHIPLFGWAMTLMRPIAIDRRAGRKAAQQVLEDGRRRLDEGIWVIIFPEGTRMAPGERGRYHVGGARLAHATGRPVVPVAHNAGRVWPRNSFFKYPGTVRVVIGPAVETAGLTAGEINRRVEDWIEGTMARIDGGAGPGAATGDIEKGARIN